MRPSRRLRPIVDPQSQVRATWFISLSFIGVAAILTATSIPSSGAGEATPRLSEGAGLVTKIGDNAIAVTYWVSRPEGFDVVTTIDTDAGGQSPNGSQSVARFSSQLLPDSRKRYPCPARLEIAARACRSAGSRTASKSTELHASSGLILPNAWRRSGGLTLTGQMKPLRLYYGGQQPLCRSGADPVLHCLQGW